MNTNINLFLVIYPFFITLYLLLHLSNVSHRRRVREREYSYSPIVLTGGEGVRD